MPNKPTAIASLGRAAICDLSWRSPGGEKNGTKWQLGAMFRATSLSDLQPGCPRLVPLVPLVSGGEGVSGREPKRDQNRSSFSGGWRGGAELLARHIAAAHEALEDCRKRSKIARTLRRLQARRVCNLRRPIMDRAPYLRCLGLADILRKHDVCVIRPA